MAVTDTAPYLGKSETALFPKLYSTRVGESGIAMRVGSNGIQVVFYDAEANVCERIPPFRLQLRIWPSHNIKQGHVWSRV